ASGDVRCGGRRAIPPQRRFARGPRRLGRTGVSRHLEPQPRFLRRRRGRRDRAVRRVARRLRARQHRPARRGRSADRYRNPALAAVQPTPLFAEPVAEHGLLGSVDVCRLLPTAVGMDSRGRGVRRSGVALRRGARMKLVGFVLLALFVHGPLSRILPTAFEATLLYYARLYPAWVLALLGTAGASIAEGINYRLIDWAAELPKLASVRSGRVVRWSVTAFVIFSPIPDSAVRILAPLGHYPLPQFLAAVAVGRFPRLLIIAGVGVLVRPPTWCLVSGTLAIAALVLGRPRLDT